MGYIVANRYATSVKRDRATTGGMMEIVTINIKQCENCGKLEAENEKLKAELQNAKEQHSAMCDMYQELTFAVESKYNGETRHDTALKYIRQAENAQIIARKLREG